MDKSTSHYCTLTPVQQNIRRAQMRADILPFVCDVYRAGNTLQLVFAQSSDIQQLLEKFIALEQQCCGFLDFSLNEDHDSLSLLIEGSTNTADVIDLFQKTIEGEIR